jgi:hypothetical protein
LSEEEYESLRTLCVTEGARSVSDYARSALCQVMTHGNGNGYGEIRDNGVSLSSDRQPATQNLIDSMQKLSDVIARLSQLIEKGPVQSNGSQVKDRDV